MVINKKTLFEEKDAWDPQLIYLPNFEDYSGKSTIAVWMAMTHKLLYQTKVENISNTVDPNQLFSNATKDPETIKIYESKNRETKESLSSLVDFLKQIDEQETGLNITIPLVVSNSIGEEKLEAIKLYYNTLNSIDCVEPIIVINYKEDPKLIIIDHKYNQVHVPLIPNELREDKRIVPSLALCLNFKKYGNAVEDKENILKKYKNFSITQQAMAVAIFDKANTPYN